MQQSGCKGPVKHRNGMERSLLCNKDNAREAGIIAGHKQGCRTRKRPWALDTERRLWCMRVGATVCCTGVDPQRCTAQRRLEMQDR